MEVNMDTITHWLMGRSKGTWRIKNLPFKIFVHREYILVLHVTDEISYAIFSYNLSSGQN